MKKLLLYSIFLSSSVFADIATNTYISSSYVQRDYVSNTFIEQSPNSQDNTKDLQQIKTDISTNKSNITKNKRSIDAIKKTASDNYNTIHSCVK